MTTKEQLLALAKRVEAATEPSIDLDMDIAEATWGPVRPGYWPERRQRFASGEYPRDCPPAYTISLDVAMSLVPEEYDWAVLRTNGGLTIHAWCGNGTDVFGDTPALALTAAALRARAAIL